MKQIVLIDKIDPLQDKVKLMLEIGKFNALLVMEKNQILLMNYSLGNSKWLIDQELLKIMWYKSWQINLIFCINVWDFIKLLSGYKPIRC